MDTLLMLCSENKKSGALESQMKRLTGKLADVCAVQEKYVIERQATKDASDANDVAEKLALALAEEVLKVRTTHAQKQLVCSDVVGAPKVQLISAQKRADNVESDRDGANARLEQLQRGQQRYWAAVSRNQSEIASLGNVLVQDCKFMRCPLEHSNDHMFCVLVQKLF